MGLSASGKSILAFTLERNLLDVGSACYVLDGDKYQTQIEYRLGILITGPL